MKRLLLALVVLIASLFFFTESGFGQSYYFNLEELIVDVFFNEDGSAQIVYRYTFNNDPGASPIDFVDLAFPPYVSLTQSDITADIDGQPVSYVSTSEYQGDGSGVAVALGSRSIPPGGTGKLNVTLNSVRGLLFTESQDPSYASVSFSPAYFVSSIVHGSTSMTVSFHLPPGVKPEEPRWHESPSGWPTQPETSLDDQGRVTYTWTNTQAQADKKYVFGASFPANYVPTDVVSKPSVSQSLGIAAGALTSIGFFSCFIGFIVLIIVLAYRSTTHRKLQYLPPKIAIEGHGIKRGLTAVEAAILLEQPLDKVLTMILFGTIKKNAAKVTKHEPLKIEVSPTLPEGLQPYELKFLQAFQASASSRKRELQEMMIDLVQSLANKMKGFSRKETIAYYRDIVERAWAQVEAAETPEVKSGKFDEVMEWTMLDKNYEGRTRDVFGPGPVIVPTWWPRFDPNFGRTIATRPTAIPAPSSPGGGGLTMPTLPGSAFAGSIVTGMQNFSRGVVGSVTDFTSSVTNKTNPVPVSTSSTWSSGRSGGGGGHSCACACACAGCACACAGGGR
jgi:hypothetical protein